MSDIYQRVLGRQLGRAPGRTLGRGDMTQAQQELQPYIEEERTKLENKKKIMPALAMVFDLLQRGQYTGVNIIDEIIKSVQGDEGLDKDIKDVIVAAYEGVTGKRKGRFEETLKDTLGWDPEPLFPGAKKDFVKNLDLADVLGFAGDVLLDPLTWISFGSTKAATTAAGIYAKEVVKLGPDLLGKYGDDILKKVAKQTFDIDTFKKIAANESRSAAEKYLVKHGGDFAKFQSQLYNRAHKEALTHPFKQLKFKDAVLKNFTTTQKGVAAKVGESGLSLREAHPLFKELTGGTGGLERVLAGAGQTKWQPLVGKTPLGRGWDVLTSKYGMTPMGSSIGNAWWTVMNKGVIGDIRRKLGFKNPYQRMLNFDAVKVGESVLPKAAATYKQYLTTTNQWSDELRQAIVKTMDIAEAMYPVKKKKKIRFKILDVLNDPKQLAKIGYEDIDELKQAVHYVDDLMRNVNSIEKGQIAKGLADERGVKDFYLGTYTREAGGKPGGGLGKQAFEMKRGDTRAFTAKQQEGLIAYLFEFNEHQAKEFVERSNLSQFSMDLDELIKTRLYAHSQFMAKTNLIEKLKQFGIGTSELSEGMQKPATRLLGSKKQSIEPYTGLAKIDHPALKDLWFDKDVAAILDKAVDMSDRDSPILKAIGTYTQYWKGIVTMTTGFHARNFISNTVTGFLRHGPKWFNINKGVDSLAGTIYALNKMNINAATKAATSLGLSETLFKKALNKRVGGYTVKELADYALDTGVISTATKGFGPADFMSEGKTSLNPFSKSIRAGAPEFVGISASHKVGNYVENTPRFKSFMLHVSDTMDNGVQKELFSTENPLWAKLTQEGKESEAFLDYAVGEAKKWFLDYGDLTDFERKWMKNIIPFYSWLRKNIVNQIEGIVLYPGIYSMVPKAQDAIRTDDPNFDPTLIPEWMKGMEYFPVSKKGRQIFALMNPNLPMQDLARVPLEFAPTGSETGLQYYPKLNFEEVKADLMNATHPILKSVVELAVGKDLWRQQDLEDTRRAPYVLSFFAKKPEMLGVIDGFLRTIGFDGVNPEVDKDGYLMINGKLAKVMENNLPVLKRMEDILFGGQVVGEKFVPGLEDAFEEATGAKDRYDALEKMFQVMSRFLGIKLKAVDIERAKEDENKGLYYRSQAARTKDRRERPGYEYRSSVADVRTGATMRKLGL